MSSPGDSGPRASSRDVRRDPSDAAVTASLPAVSDAGGASPYPHGGMPASVRDDWKGPSAPRSASPSGRTEVVPNVAPVPSSGRMPFDGPLPPRPGEGKGGAPASGSGASGSTTATGRRPLRERAGRAPKPARRAQLTLRRVNVWSVFKFSCMLAIALWLVWMIAIGVLYGILDASGVVSSINDAVAQVQGADTAPVIRPGQVLGIAAIVGVVNIVLFIALSSLFAVIYNLVSDFVGGIEVTLSERE